MALRIAIVSLLVMTSNIHAADAPGPAAGDALLKPFAFASGETLPEVRLHYRTFGAPVRGADGKVANAILILHGTGGSGGSLLEGASGRMFAGELFGPGQPLDAAKFYIIVPDNLGHGKSAKPSDGLRGRFPPYAYADMIQAQYRLLQSLKVDHLRLVMGTSMGGMHTWLWAETHPEFMDALMPLACLPTQISGRNRQWRKVISDAIRNDPDWKGGAYETQPRSLRTAVQISLFMSSNPVLRQAEGPTLKAADEFIEKSVAARLAATDANDLLYAIESSRDYDPGPRLETIRAPLFAINFADDLINPPELGILEREIKRVPKGQSLVLPLTAETIGHGTHTKAIVWKQHLEKLLKDTER